MHFLQRFIQKPPVLFPLVALFHIAMLGYGLYSYSTEPFPSLIWVQPLWLLLYTFSWVFVCDMKRWAAIAYVLLTVLNLSLRFLLTSSIDINNFTDALFPADILFSFLALFYYRQLQ